MKKPKVIMTDNGNLDIEPLPLSNNYDAVKEPGSIDMLIKVEKTLPDLILLNTMMSNKNGYAVLRGPKTYHKTRFIPILL